MKLFVVAAVLGVCLADRLDNKYLPPRGNAGAGFGPGFNGAGPKPGGFGGAGSFGAGGAGGSGGAGGFGASAAYNAGGGGAGGYNAGGSAGLGGTQYSGNVYNAGAGQYSSRQSSADAAAQILRSNSEVTADGFAYDFETSNGIRADAQGVATNGVQSQGSFAYKGDDGQDYSITYTADENGYQPQGAHLPTPPPIPEEILKSLEQNARDEAAGIVDDGTYRGEGAGAGGSAGYTAGGSAGYTAGGAAGGRGSFGGASSGFGGHSGSGGFGAGGAGGSGGFGGQSGAGGFGAGGAGSSGSFGGAGGSGGFGAAASRQYLAPKAGPNGSGSFNAQTGYKY